MDRKSTPDLAEITDPMCDTEDEMDRGDNALKANDYFKERDGEKFAGLHLLLDCYGCRNLTSVEFVEACLRRAAIAADATVLHVHLHHFTESGGISGVALLAESHISFHSWPEHAFAALDVFMCGEADPHKTISIIEEAFQPAELKTTEVLRGRDAVEWNAGSKKNCI